MKFSPNNFLTNIKQIVMGGGRHTDGQPYNDAGFLLDIPVSPFDIAAASGNATLTDSTGGVVSTTLAAITAGAAYAQADATAMKNAIASLAAQVNKLTTAINLTASETNLAVLSSPASTTAIGTLNFTIPRDYDEATDFFSLQMGMASAGATDTPTVSATIYRKRPGSAIATVATGVTGKLLGVSTAANLSSTEKVLVFDAVGKGLKRDDTLTIVVTSGAHTTDAVLTYFAKHVYRSTLVSYNETDGTKPSLGNPLR